MIGTCNYKARNDRIEIGESVKSHKRRKVSVERIMGECCQWKATGQCSRRDCCSFSHGSNRGQRAQSSSSAPKAQTQIDGRKPSKGFGPEGESPSGRKGLEACKHFLKGTCSNSSCNYWHLSACQTTNLYRDANSATNVCSDTLRLMGSPKKVEEKWWKMICFLTEGVSTIGLRVSRYRTSEEVCSTEK